MLSKTDCMKINSLYGCFNDPAVNRKIQIICAMVGIWLSCAISDIGQLNIFSLRQNSVNLNKSVPARFDWHSRQRPISLKVVKRMGGGTCLGLWAFSSSEPVPGTVWYFTQMCAFKILKTPIWIHTLAQSHLFQTWAVKGKCISSSLSVTQAGPVGGWVHSWWVCKQTFEHSPTFPQILTHWLDYLIKSSGITKHGWPLSLCHQSGFQQSLLGGWRANTNIWATSTFPPLLTHCAALTMCWSTNAVKSNNCNWPLSVSLLSELYCSGVVE